MHNCGDVACYVPCFWCKFITKKQLREILAIRGDITLWTNRKFRVVSCDLVDDNNFVETKKIRRNSTDFLFIKI